MKYLKIGKRNKATMAVTLMATDMAQVKYAVPGAKVYWEVVNGFLTLKPKEVVVEKIDAEVVSSNSV